MTRTRAVEAFDVEIRRAEALRLLGMRKKRRQPRESVLQCFEEEFAAAHDRVAARAVWTMIERGLPGSDFIDPGVPVAVAVCTIGSALEERVASLVRSGESARAMILDAIGSAAVETVADRCNGRICARAIDAGFSPGRRRSPGYGRWDVGEQGLIFDLLDPGEVGVTLTAGCMMDPNKSISFLVPLDGEPQERASRRCARCGLIDCEYRDH